ncbi:MAG: zinc ribbon domain-containing protein YjdM [Bacteroidota bacterium]
MSKENNCPKCNSENTYQDSNLWVCPDCFHEWDSNGTETTIEGDSEVFIVKDSNGNILNDGDSVSVIKDLKVKGSASGIKAGTKVKSIRLIESSDGHNISCKIDGIGAMYLKSEFVKKV